MRTNHDGRASSNGGVEGLDASSCGVDLSRLVPCCELGGVASSGQQRILTWTKFRCQAQNYTRCGKPYSSSLPEQALLRDEKS
jgi:hypothetical protein